jgi:hypothetical protein
MAVNEIHEGSRIVSEMLEMANALHIHELLSEQDMAELLLLIDNVG